MSNKINSKKELNYIFSLILIILTFTSCFSTNDQKTNNNQLTDSILNKDSIIPEIPDQPKLEYIQIKDSLINLLEGKWYSTEYVDSTVKNRKIYDYTGDYGMSTFELTFDKMKPDTISFKGYWESYSAKIVKVNPTSYLIGKDSIILMKKGDEYIVNYKRYIDNLKKWGDNLYSRKGFKIEDRFKYFAKNIFAGKYFDIDRNKTIFLRDNFSVEGVDSVEKFELRDGVSEFCDYIDVFHFGGSYHWKFNHDTLILQKAKPVDDEGGSPNGYELLEVRYRLIKQK